MSQLPKPKADMELVQGARKRMGEGFGENQADRRLTAAVYTHFMEKPLGYRSAVITEEAVVTAAHERFTTLR